MKKPDHLRDCAARRRRERAALRRRLVRQPYEAVVEPALPAPRLLTRSSKPHTAFNRKAAERARAVRSAGYASAELLARAFRRGMKWAGAPRLRLEQPPAHIAEKLRLGGLL